MAELNKAKEQLQSSKVSKKRALQEADDARAQAAGRRGVRAGAQL